MPSSPMTTLSPPPARLVIYPLFEYGLGKLLVSPLRPYSTIGTERRYDPENFQVRRVRDPKLETPLRAFHQGRVLPTRALHKRRDPEPAHRFRMTLYTPTANRISPFLPRDPRLPRLSGPRLLSIECAAATLELNPNSHILAGLRGHPEYAAIFLAQSHQLPAPYWRQLTFPVLEPTIPCVQQSPPCTYAIPSRNRSLLTSGTSRLSR